MNWRVKVISAIAGITFVGVIQYEVWFMLHKRINGVEQQLLPLSSNLTNLTTQLQQLSSQTAQLSEQVTQLQGVVWPSQAVSVEEVNAIYEELRATLSVSNQLRVEQEEFLAEQIANAHDYINEINRNVKEQVADVLQVHTNRYQQVYTQTQSTQQSIQTLLETLKQAQSTKHWVAGTVLSFAGPVTLEVQQQLETAGWLICDGREVAIESYPALYQVIREIYGTGSTGNFKLPDFRGVFLRGLDAGKQLDIERILGSYQADSYQAHIHGTEMEEAGDHTHQSSLGLAGKHDHRLEAKGYWFTSKQRNERPAMTNAVDDNQDYRTTQTGEHTHSVEIAAAGKHQHLLHMSESGGAETRPKNYPVTYIIRF